ncbi:MAG: hypothetical protein HQL04_01930 [Nitrospirae bacterium]|nr:hypothetical protein [Nitrospirota bacterium]
MNKKLVIVKLIIAMICVFAVSTIALAEDIVIFSVEQSKRPVIAYSKCNLPSSKQFVRVSERSGINWKWEYKNNDWCGWGIQDIPLKAKNVKEYLTKGFLVIKFTGEHTGRAPEVAFRDKDNNQSSLINFEGYVTEEKEDKLRTVKIPLKSFFGNDPNFYPAEPTKIFELKFDAEVNSASGRLKISYIAIAIDDEKKDEKKDKKMDENREEKKEERKNAPK